MAFALSPEELACNAATPAWRELPAVKKRIAELVAFAVENGLEADAAGFTAMAQHFHALQKIDKMPDVPAAMAAGLV